MIAITTTKQIVKVTGTEEKIKDMRSFVLFNRQVAFFAVVGALLLSIILPVIASAAQLTERSIALSTSAADADGVSYTVKFTADGAAGAFVVDFCTNTPLIGEACTSPAGFSVVPATSATAGFTGVQALNSDADTNTVRVTGTIAADDEVEVQLDNINNPSAVGPLYARIITYDTAGNADLYDSTETFAEDANRVDEGGAAIQITNTIGVQAAVLESLTFCVSGADDIGEDCTPTDAALDAPTLKLGEQVGDLFALSPNVVSEGSIYTQLSTNAATGAVVSLKSSTVGCGGLLRFGSTDCDIEPAVSGGVTTTSGAKFGVKTTTAAGVGATANGVLQPSAGYNNSTFALGWILGDATGVTSTFGDPFLNTNNLPANNQNMELIFGATVTNDTPAGLYSADLNLIATGKF